MEVRVMFTFIVFFFFFFQAEDGIRDYKVTGVQTCALPIWGVRMSRFGGDCERRGDDEAFAAGRRSEERRVGKECRSRWSPDHLKKTKTMLGRLTASQIASASAASFFCRFTYR